MNHDEGHQRPLGRLAPQNWAWGWQVVEHLQRRGASYQEQDRVVRLMETLARRQPLELLGSPAHFAEQAPTLAADEVSPARRLTLSTLTMTWPALGGLLTMVLTTMGLMFGCRALAGGEPTVGVGTGLAVAVAGIILMVGVMVFFVDWALRHLLIAVLGGTALMTVIIVVAVLMSGTLFEVPTQVMVLVSAIAALANVAMFLALAARLRRAGGDHPGEYIRDLAGVALLLALGAPLLGLFG